MFGNAWSRVGRVLLVLAFLASSASGVAVAGPGDQAPVPEGQSRSALTRSFAASDRDSDRFEPEFVEGEVLVRFAPGASAAAATVAHERAGGRMERAYQVVSGLQHVRLTRGQSVEAAVAAYEAMPGVLYAQPNYIKRIAAMPDDPGFSYLWGLHNTGQTGGTADADIDAPEAWDITTGSEDVIIAVIDTGVDYNHPDLVDNMWTNPGEIPGNGIDDDGNGYIDDVYGWNAAYGNGDPMDDQGHGTHCAGTIGAVGDNGIGVTGVNWNVSIMALKMLDASGSGSTTDALECFEYMDTMGAHLSSNSWGGWYAFDQAEYDAIAAIDKLFVFAAGNEGKSIEGASTFRPAGYDLPNILSVGATDHNDTRALWPSGDGSNYGATRVDVFAPGKGILSTAPGVPRLGIAPDATVNVIYSTDFTTLNGWFTTQSNVWSHPWALTTSDYTSAPSSVAHLGYGNEEEAYIIKQTLVDLSGSDYPGLRFQCRYDVEPTYDFVDVWIQGTATGQWDLVESATGDSGGFVEWAIDLAPYAGQSVDIAFGIWADEVYDSSYGFDGVWIDDVEVFDLDPGSGSPWAWQMDYSGSYVTMSGTSMAAPHAAGLAGLLLAQDDTRSWETLKNTIMATVDAKAALSGLCVTGGRINALAALEHDVPNRAPVAVNDSYSTKHNTLLTVTAPGVLGNDTDADGDTLTMDLVSTPSWAQTWGWTSGGGFTYRPTEGFSGTDTFTYRAYDGEEYSNVATVTITVGEPNTPPVANDDAYTATYRAYNTPALSVAAPGVLANDTDADSDPLTAVKLSDPAHGSLTLNTNGSFTYTPDEGFLGTDTFTYRASDGTAHSPAATVTITVALPGGAHRVAGLNRYLTSVAASKRAFLSASTVVVATGDNWPDALGGSALAGAVEGPLLLTSSASLPSGVRDEIVRLKAKKVYVLGGKAAVSDTVLNQIKGIPGVTSVERVSGNDRYGTARAIADKAIAELNARGTYSGGALVATGGNFPDATAASPLAASLGWPILLVNPANGSVYVPSSTDSALILGGTGVVSTSVESALKSRLGTASVDRAGGANRYETAAKIADKGVAAGMRWNGVGVATGENFPDALAGGAMLGAFDSVMLLTPGSALDTYARGRLQTNAAQIRTLHVVGGTTVVSDPTMAAAKSAAGITP